MFKPFYFSITPNVYTGVSVWSFISTVNKFLHISRIPFITCTKCYAVGTFCPNSTLQLEENPNLAEDFVVFFQYPKQGNSTGTNSSKNPAACTVLSVNVFPAMTCDCAVSFLSRKLSLAVAGCLGTLDKNISEMLQ